MIAQGILGANLHRFRGMGEGRYLPSLGFGAATYLTQDWVSAAIVALGYFLFVSFGWGQYFTNPIDFTKPPPFPVNKEIPWIDYLVSKLPNNIPFRKWVAMTLRGLYAMPIFIGLGVYGGNYLALLYGVLFAVLMGSSYFVTAWIDYKFTKLWPYTDYAEIMIGFFLGIAIVACYAIVI